MPTKIDILNDRELLAARDRHLQRAQAIFRGEAVKPILQMQHIGVSADIINDGVDIMDNPELWVRCVLEKLVERLDDFTEDDTRDETTLRLLIVDCIASLFSSRYMDKLFGSKVWFDGRLWVADELPTDVGTLEYPDLDKHPAYIALERAIREFKKADVKLPYFMPPSFGGPLNTAVNLYGTRFLEAVYTDPEKAHRDLRIIADVTKDLYRRMLSLVPAQQLICYTVAIPGYALLAGCTTQLISADMYRDVFMPIEEEVYTDFPNGYIIHVCGSSLQHVPNFRAMRNLRGLEVGYNRNRWEHFERYYHGLREDQVVFLWVDEAIGCPVPEALDKIARLTEGRRIIVVGVQQQGKPIDAETKRIMDGALLTGIQNGWMFKTDAQDEGERQKWFLDKPDALWRSISIDRAWTQQGYNYHGAAWYSVTVPPLQVDASRRIYLLFHAVDGCAVVWINGVKVGEQLKSPNFMWDRPWALEVTHQLTPGQEFQLTVRVSKKNCAAGIWKPVELRMEQR